MERATPLRRYDTWSAPAPEDLEAAVEGVPYLTEVSNNHYTRPSGPDRKSTAVETQAARLSSELKSWRRFIPNFGRETEDGLKHEPFTLKNQLAATIFNHWVRALLLLTPVGLAVHYAHFNSTTDFLVNFFAVLPLTDMFGQALVEFKMWSQDPRMEWIAYALFGSADPTS